MWGAKRPDRSSPKNSVKMQLKQFTVHLWLAIWHDSEYAFRFSCCCCCAVKTMPTRLSCRIDPRSLFHRKIKFKNDKNANYSNVKSVHTHNQSTHSRTMFQKAFFVSWSLALVTRLNYFIFFSSHRVSSLFATEEEMKKIKLCKTAAQRALTERGQEKKIKKTQKKNHLCAYRNWFRSIFHSYAVFVWLFENSCVSLSLRWLSGPLWLSLVSHCAHNTHAMYLSHSEWRTI